MINQPCAPLAPPVEAIFLAMADNPCEAVRQLTAAQYQLEMGRNVASVRFGDQETRFSRVDANALAKLVSKAQALCDSRHGRGRAVRVGPHARWTAPRNGWGFGGY